MIQRIALLTVIAAISVSARAASVTLDAADRDRDGVAFVGYAAVRPIIDNTAGATALTNVRFKIEIHAGTLGGTMGWAWDDPDNPWYGARQPEALRPDGALYTQGHVYYPATGDWAPYFQVDPTPGLPASGDEYELLDQVPAGMCWDRPMKITGWLGGEIELFSVAAGQLDSNELTVTVYDSDPAPQTVPEPAIAVVLVLAIAALRRRR